MLRRTIADLDARTQQDKHRAARNERRVTRSTAPDGMGELWAFLPVQDAQTVYAAIERVAGTLSVDGDDRSADHRRADALVAIAEAILTTWTSPTDHVYRTEPPEQPNGP